MDLERVQERGERVFFFLGHQIHLETLVAKLKKLAQVAGCAVVKVRSTRRKTAQDGSFGAAHVAAGISSVDHVGSRRLRRILKRIGASGDLIDREIRNAERRKAVRDERIMFIDGIVSGADIEGGAPGRLTPGLPFSIIGCGRNRLQFAVD
jgi:hypothetical protein